MKVTSNNKLLQYKNLMDKLFGHKYPAMAQKLQKKLTYILNRS